MRLYGIREATGNGVCIVANIFYDADIIRTGVEGVLLDPASDNVSTVAIVLTI